MEILRGAGRDGAGRDGDIASEREKSKCEDGNILYKLNCLRIVHGLDRFTAVPFKPPYQQYCKNIVAEFCQFPPYCSESRQPQFKNFHPGDDWYLMYSCSDRAFMGLTYGTG